MSKNIISMLASCVILVGIIMFILGVARFAYNKSNLSGPLMDLLASVGRPSLYFCLPVFIVGMLLLRYSKQNNA